MGTRFSPSTSVSPPSASFHHCSTLIFICMFFLQKYKCAKFQNIKKTTVLSEIGERSIERIATFFYLTLHKLRALSFAQRTPCTCIFCFLVFGITSRLYAHSIELNTQVPTLPRVANVATLLYLRQCHSHHTNTSYLHVVISDCSKLRSR